MGDADPLFHPPRESADFGISAFLQMHRAQGLLHHFVPLAGIPVALQKCLVVQELAGAHVLIGTEFLGQVADQCLQFLPLVGQIDAIYADLALVLFQNAANDAHQRGFASTVGADQPEHTALDFQ